MDTRYSLIMETTQTSQTTTEDTTMTTKTTKTTRYELTFICNGRPAGFGGFFSTRQEAERARAKAPLSGKIKRVRF